MIIQQKIKANLNRDLTGIFSYMQFDRKFYIVTGVTSKYLEVSVKKKCRIF